MAWNGYSEKGQGSEERGPGTFTFAPPATPQAQGSNAVMAKAGYQTAQAVGGLTDYNEGGDKTAAAIFGFAETLLKPMAAELAERKFLEGVQRASSGEALTEIVNTQPWYSKIFGPSSAVEGARQYSLDAQAAKFDAAVQQAMPTLRNTSPDELPGIIQKMSKEFETGDPTTDAQLGLRLTKVLPNLIQAHTREYYKAQQEHAYNQRFDAAQQNATSLQIVSQDPMASEDDKQLRQATFLQGFVLPAGVDPESHKQFIQTSLASLAEAGQFHALGVALKSGVASELAPEKRLQLERQVLMFKKQAARDAIDSYTEQIVTIQAKAANNEFSSGKEVLDAFNAINEDYAKRTGNDEPVVHRALQGSTVLTARQAYLAYQREVGKAVAAAQAPQDQMLLADQALGTMTYNKAVDAVKAAGGKESIVADAARRQWLNLRGDPKAQAAWLIKTSYDGGYVASIKDDITERIGRAQDAKDANFIYGYELYKQLLEQHPSDNGPNHAIAAYMSPKDAARYAAFHDALGGQSIADAGERAFALSRQIIVNPGYTFNKDEDKAWASFEDNRLRGNTITDGVTLTGNQTAYFGAPAPLTPTSSRIVKSLAQSNWKVAQQTNKQDPYAQAVAMAQQQGLEMYGSYAWVNGRGRPSLESKLAFPASGTPFTKTMIANGLNSFMKKRLRDLTDRSVDDVFITRGPDSADGDPTFVFSAYAGNQWLPETVFTGRELSQHIQEMLADPAKSKFMDVGPNNTYGGAYIGYRSPRRSAEAEAKVKEAQASRSRALADKLSDRRNYQFGPKITFPRSK